MADRASMRAALWLFVVISMPVVSMPVDAAVPQGTQEVVTQVWLHDVPGPPSGDFWHPSEALNVFNLRGVYPNVILCARPLQGGSSTCAAVCMSFQGDTKLGGKLKSNECQRPLHLVLPANDRRLAVEVSDMNSVLGQLRFHALIARFGVTDPSTCPDTKPCEMAMPKGTLALSFTTLPGPQVAIANAAAPGKCQPPTTQWPDPQSGLHGPYVSVEDAMQLDPAGGIAWALTAGAEYGFYIVRDQTQKSGGYYTTPPVQSSQPPGTLTTPRVTVDDYNKSLAKAFIGSCANPKNFQIAATVHTHPQPFPGETLLGFIDNFSEPDFNQAIKAQKIPVPPAGTFPVCKAQPSPPRSPFEKIVMINEHDGVVRTFTAQTDDSAIPDDQISSFSLIVRFNSLWNCYAKRVTVIGHYNKPP
jgi:hypothetical protein